MAGREVIENGLPSHDALTIYGLGATWTDQQWLAQVFMYGVYSLGGFALLSIVTCASVVGAFALAAAASRSLGAGARAIWLLFLPVLVSAALGWSIRAQMLTLPLYTGLLWLLAAQARRPTNRVWIALPMLVLWANMHGSAALGALLVVLLGAYELVRSRGGTWKRSLALIVARAARHPRDAVRPGDDGALLPPPARRSALRGAGDRVAVAGARLQHLRLLRAARDGGSARDLGTSTPDRLRHRRSRAHPGGRAHGDPRDSRGSRSRAWCSFPSLSAGASRAASPASRDEASTPSCASCCPPRSSSPPPRSSSAATRGSRTTGRTSRRRRFAPSCSPGDRVFVPDRFSDWLLWKIPELRGRIAYDVRFEIYDRAFFNRLANYNWEQGSDWKSFADGYRIVVVDETNRSHTADFLKEPGTRVIYRGDELTVIARPRT